jgi:hypothetical protein
MAGHLIKQGLGCHTTASSFCMICQAQNCQLDLRLVMALQMGGYGPSTLQSDLASSYFHLFGPLQKHLAGKRFATDASRNRMSPSGYRHLTPISSMPGCKPCHNGTNGWMSLVSMWISDDYHTLPMCHVYTEVWTNFLASKCLLPYFLKLLCLIFIFHNLLFMWTYTCEEC